MKDQDGRRTFFTNPRPQTVQELGTGATRAAVRLRDLQKNRKAPRAAREERAASRPSPLNPWSQLGQVAVSLRRRARLLTLIAVGPPRHQLQRRESCCSAPCDGPREHLPRCDGSLGCRSGMARGGRLDTRQHAWQYFPGGNSGAT